MMYTIHAPDYADGTYVLAEFDLEALYQQDKSPIEVGKVYPCPLCNGAPQPFKDKGHWYLMGMDTSCPCCGHLWSLPDEEEVADMKERNHA